MPLPQRSLSRHRIEDWYERRPVDWKRVHVAQRIRPIEEIPRSAVAVTSEWGEVSGERKDPGFSREDWARRLAEAKNRRDFSAVLMDNDWLGLHVLVAVRRSQHQDPDTLHEDIARAPKEVFGQVVRLMSAGLLRASEGRLSCSATALAAIAELEKQIGLIEL